jgi:5'-3' exonuclease
LENESKEESFTNQKQRVKQYLEEMFVRQLETENSEADDLIAHYCKVSLEEEKTIFSSDRDLTQLISEKVSIYSPQAKRYYKFGDKIKLKDYEFPHNNIKTVKILTGDSSDNIDGIFYLGEKTLVKFFPEILDSEVSFTDI